MNMNKERFNVLAAAYHAGLLKAVKEYPADYGIANADQCSHYAESTANKMLHSIKKSEGIFHVNVTGKGWENACKALGIKHTRKAIINFLAGN